MTTKTLFHDDIVLLARRALTAHGASEQQATSTAAGIAAAECDGVASHGLPYLVTFCQHLLCGKVDGKAVPEVSTTMPGTVIVDAKTGFAHAAIALGLPHLMAAARTQGVALLAIRNSYNCGVLGYHTERVAKEGLLCLGFTNAPASIAPWGGHRPALGTNPWSVAVPGQPGEAALVIDQSASVVSKSEVMRHRRAEKPIPLGWALDADGQPTTNAAEGLAGSMVPSGGYKGVGSALLVELMAACLTGAMTGTLASPFSGDKGGPPRTGQLFIAIDPAATSGGFFAERLTMVLRAFAAEPGARVPGSAKRSARERASVHGVRIDAGLLDQILAMTQAAQPG